MENKIKKIIKESIKKTIYEVILGQNTEFTPYTPKERERNFQGLTQMSNPSYENFMKWKKQEMLKGRNKNELSWNVYLQEVNPSIFNKG